MEQTTIKVVRPARKLPAAKTAEKKVRASKRAIHVFDFGRVSSMPKLELIDFIREGVPPRDFKEMVKRMNAPQGRVVRILGVSIATINRKSANNENLSPAYSERVVGLAKLIGQVDLMVKRSGDPEGFDAATWVSRWLEQPIPALGGKMPADFMDTSSGQEVVSNLLSMMESGAYA